MACDHRASFAKTIMGWQKPELSKDDLTAVGTYKDIIYEALQKAFALGAPKDQCAILIDEGSGDRILRDAKERGITTILTVEKSGQKEFAFEYGNEFAQHIEKYKPDFAKVLIHYNPEGDKESNRRQQQSLKVLSDYCRTNHQKLLIEPLVGATPSQLESVAGDKDKYDRTIRPKLAASLIKELQDAGIEVDIWKLEGLYEVADHDAVVKQMRSNGRENVSMVILGRDASTEQVDQWLSIGAGNPGVVGFAIGRTIFEEQMIKYHEGEIDAGTASDEIAKRFFHFYQTFKSARG